MPTPRFVLVPFLAALAAAPLRAADQPTGAEIYAKQCARCHGANGEGSKKYKDALVGDKSVAALADVTKKTMPEDDPGSLSAADAKKVAEFMHAAFYSPDAQARNRPPRVELARLTVRQYRNTVADLIGSFRPAAKWDDTKPGLRGEYFTGRGFRPNARMLDRTDPEVRFDWDTASPEPGKIEAEQFAVRWGGAVLAPETGVYDFVVRTDHAARLWVNDPVKPLIDVWVKSGSETEHRASLFLLAGRAYPLRLEFSKAKQGVDDTKKNKPKPTPASISLEWKRPLGATEPIAARFLSPGRAAEAFVIATAFPPDDRSLGWERGTTVSKAWDAATTDAALDTAGYVAAKIEELTGLKPADVAAPVDGNPAAINTDAKPEVKIARETRTKKLREFATTFAERAFRRPLTPEQKALYIDHQFEAAKDPDLALKRVLILVLKSPRFLYHDAGAVSDGYAVASRLAYALWDAPPDSALLAAASAGKLASRAEVSAQAERMLADPRAKAKLRDFVLTWLKLDQPPDMAKDPKRFPGFTPAVVADLRTSLELLIDEVLASPNADFRDLLLEDDVYMNRRLVKFYGVPTPSDHEFRKVNLNGDHRAGVLTHPYLMAAFSYVGTTSPIHRGVFLARGILGINLRPPQEAFSPLAEDLHPNLSTRERVALQTKPAACVTCHGLINPLGFTLEHFDAVGRYREKDGPKPVDSTGAYRTRTGDTKTFRDERELAVFLAGSEEVHGAFAEQLFQHLAKQPVRAYGLKRPEELRRFFTENGFNIRKLAAECATVAALSSTPPPAAR